jgi:predicted amidophosphoribosyltransferase
MTCGAKTPTAAFGRPVKRRQPLPLERPMICPRCRIDNLEQAHFCSTCGVALKSVCPACGNSTDGAGIQ